MQMAHQRAHAVRPLHRGSADGKRNKSRFRHMSEMWLEGSRLVDSSATGAVHSDTLVSQGRIRESEVPPLNTRQEVPDDASHQHQNERYLTITTTTMTSEVSVGSSPTDVVQLMVEEEAKPASPSCGSTVPDSFSSPNECTRHNFSQRCGTGRPSWPSLLGKVQREPEVPC